MKAFLKSLTWRDAVFAVYLLIMSAGLLLLDMTPLQQLWALAMHWFGYFLAKGRYPVLEATITAEAELHERR